MSLKMKMKLEWNVFDLKCDCFDYRFRGSIYCEDFQNVVVVVVVVVDDAGVVVEVGDVVADKNVAAEVVVALDAVNDTAVDVVLNVVVLHSL